MAEAGRRAGRAGRQEFSPPPTVAGVGDFKSEAKKWQHMYGTAEHSQKCANGLEESADFFYFLWL